MLSFKELKDQVPFGLAVVVFHDQLPEGLFEQMDWEQVESLCDYAVPGSALHKRALERSSQIEMSCHKWVNASHTRTDSGLRVVIDHMIALTASTFDDYRYALLHSQPESWLREHLESAILAMEFTAEEWARVAGDAKGGHESRLKVIAVERFVELADSFAQLCYAGEYSALFDCDESDEIRRKRIKKSLGLAQTLEEWKRLQTMIGFREKDWSEAEKIISQAVVPLAMTFDDWYIVYHIAYRQGRKSLKRRARQKMWTLAQTFHDFWILATNVDIVQESRGWYLALQKAAEVGTFKEWDDASTQRSGILRQFSVRVMADKASSIDECRTVLFHIEHLPEAEQPGYYERMLQRMLDLATIPRDVSEVSYYAGEYNEPRYQALAIEKLRAMAGIG